MMVRRAVRYNMLVNPTGREHHFRAVDWVVEQMNLFIKDMYGGEGSNYTKKRILDESALVLIYRNCHHVFEQNFLLSGLTYSHGQKDMTATFKGVQEYILGLDASPNKHLAGRSTKFEVPNALERGAAKIALEAKPSREKTVVEVQDEEVDDEEALWREVEGGGGKQDGEVGGNGNEGNQSEPDADEDLVETISAQDLAVD